jgi:4-amino-4-deoxy-L-arabinose transferase-like glycosyltransferase
MSTTSPQLAGRRPARHVSLDLHRLRASAPLAALLVVTGALYVWTLSRNGYANEYYAAAVQAGTHSWKAFLFGSLDASNYITVDKPPASLWLMELSSRAFGFSSFSMLLPQALEGVAAVALLYAAVKRWFGRPAALLSGLILALTPVAALMFRFNNPDALLVVLLVAAAYALFRALEVGSTRWLALTGAALGFAFLTKELEAFLVLPAFALVYLVAAPVPMRRRLWQLAVAGAALVVSAGWWVALVALWPASSRPYVGGSTNNSIFQVIFGSNGLDRVSGAGAPATFSGTAGFLRLFNTEIGGQISWLLPAGIVALASGVVWTRGRPRTDRTRAALLVWGGWLAVAAVIFSFMSGTIHPYYSNLLAPAIAVLVGVGATLLWQRRDQLAARILLAVMVATTAAWAFVLLDRSSTWHSWLRFAILIAGLLSAAAILGAKRLGDTVQRGVVTLAVLAALAGPAAYSLSAVATATTGSNPMAGPPIAGGGGFGGGGFPGAAGAARGGLAGAVPLGAPGSGPGISQSAGGGHSVGSSRPVSHAVASALERDASRYTWIAATSSAQNAAPIELATGKSVMALGGFSGGDPAMTLAHFEKLVAQRKIHYYISGGAPGGGGPGGRTGTGLRGFDGGLPGGAPGGFAAGGLGRSGPGGFGGPGRQTESQIESWVSSHFKSKVVGGETLYDLTQPK